MIINWLCELGWPRNATCYYAPVMIESTETSTKTEPHTSTTRILDDVKERGDNLGDRAKTKASEFKVQAKQQGSKMVDSGKRRTASKVRDFKSSTEEAAAELDSKGSRVAAAATRAVAGAAGDVAGYLDEKPANEIWNDANDFARKHPAVVFGGLLLAGLAVGRIIRASSEPNAEEEVGVATSDYPDVTPHYVGPAATDS